MRDTSALDANVLEMSERYRQGESLAVLAERYKVCGHTVKDRLTRMGIAIRSAGWYSPMSQNRHRKGEIVAEYAAGATTYELAAKYGVTRPTICNWFRAWGVERRKLCEYYPSGPLFMHGGRGEGEYLASTDRTRRGIIHIHRACWEAYHGEIPQGHDIHHIDGNKLNNTIENLQCMPPGEHSRHHAALRREGKAGELKDRHRTPMG